MLGKNLLDHRNLEFLIESLEDRRLLTGYLQIHGASNNDLIIQGSEGDELATLTLSSSRANFSVFNQWIFTRDEGFDAANIRDIRINLGDGNDRLEIIIDESDPPNVIRDIRIDQRGETASSINEFSISDIGMRDLRIEGGGGEIQVDINDIESRDLRFTNRSEVQFDYAELNVENSNLRDLRLNVPDDSNTQIDFTDIRARNARLDFGDGDSLLDLIDSTISGRVDLRGGAGTFEDQHHVRMYGSTVGRMDFRGGDAAEILSLRKSTIEGNLNFTGNSAGDEVKIQQVTIQGRANFRMGDGDDIWAHEPESGSSNSGISMFEGSLTVDLGNGDNRFTVNERPQGLSIADRLTINAGNGDDYLGLFEGSEATVAGSMRINTRGGEDEVGIFGSEINGDARITLGDGDDGIAIFGRVAGTQVSGDLDINMGDGNNTLEIDYIYDGGGTLIVQDRMTITAGSGNDIVEMSQIEEEVRFGSLRVNLGNGDDSVDLKNSEVTGDARIELGNGQDHVQLESVGFADPNSPGQIRMGSGNDEVEILQSDGNANQMNLELLLGDGNDVATIEWIAIPAAFFVSGDRGSDTLMINSLMSSPENYIQDIENVVVA